MNTQTVKKGSNWTIDSSHSVASFVIKHMMIAKVHGNLSNIQGTLYLDPEHIENSSVRATIDASTINTMEPKRDEHLKSPDFFDVGKFPVIEFKSKAFSRIKEDISLTGELTLHGISKEVQFKVEGLNIEMKDPWGNTKIGASANLKINRKDFGLNWNAALEAGGVLVGEEVTINLELQFVKSTS